MSSLIYIFIMAAGVLIASIAQVLLKSAAMQPHENKVREYMNGKVITAYGMMVLATLFSLIAYRVIPISMGSVIDATGYIYVTIFGVLIFKEAVDRRKILGLGLIIGGIVVYALLG